MLVPLLSTFGLSIALQNLLFEQFGADTRSLGTDRRSRRSPAGQSPSQIYIGALGLLIFAVAVACSAAFAVPAPYLARPRDSRHRGGPRHRGTGRHRCPRGLRHRGGDRRGHRRRSPARCSPCARTSIPIPATDATHLRLRGGRDRRHRLAVGNAGRRHRARPRADIGAQIDPRGFLLAGHSFSSRSSAARLFVPAGPAAHRISSAWRCEGAGDDDAPLRRRALDAASSSRAAAASDAGRRWPSCRWLFGANIVDRLTTLFIYIILAAIWNALAGYGGLVSVGQQAFFGSAPMSRSGCPRGMPVYLAVIAARAPSVASPRCRSRLHAAAAGPANSRSACGWSPSRAHLLVNLDPLIQGETGTSLIALNAFATPHHAYNYWLASARPWCCWASCSSCCAADRHRAAGDPRQRGRRRFARRAGARPSGSFSSSPRRLRDRRRAVAGHRVTFQPKTYFGVQWTAYMIFMVLVGGLGTFEGAILGAVLFFLIEDTFGEAGVGYMAGLGPRRPCLRCSCRAASGAPSNKRAASR